jgi:hypothetical protein
MIDFIDLRASLRLRRRRVRGCAMTALLAGLALAPAAALGAARITGTEAAVSVDAQNSSIKDILAAFGQQFNVHLQSTAALDKQITGTYEGPLRQVLARLLEGYNYIIRVRDGQLLVTVLGGRAPGNAAPASATLAAAAASQATPPVVAKTTSVAEAATTPASTAAPAPSKAGVPEVTPTNASSGPVPTFKVAEGPPPVPMPSESTSSGPVAGPPTSKMPMPAPGGATTSTTPIPAPGPSTGSVPMPSGTPTTPPAQTPQNK